MDRDGVAHAEILVGADGFARIHVAYGNAATSWGEILVPKEDMEKAWREYLKTGD